MKLCISGVHVAEIATFVAFSLSGSPENPVDLSVLRPAPVTLAMNVHVFLAETTATNRSASISLRDFILPMGEQHLVVRLHGSLRWEHLRAATGNILYGRAHVRTRRGVRVQDGQCTPKLLHLGSYGICYLLPAIRLAHEYNASSYVRLGKNVTQRCSSVRLLDPCHTRKGSLHYHTPTVGGFQQLRLALFQGFQFIFSGHGAHRDERSKCPSISALSGVR